MAYFALSSSRSRPRVFWPVAGLLAGMAAISPGPIGSVFLFVAIVALAGLRTLSVRRRMATLRPVAGTLSPPVAGLPTADGFPAPDGCSIECIAGDRGNARESAARLQRARAAGREWMMRELTSAIERARSSGRSLSIVTFAIDRFPSLEATHGRRAAEKAVVKVAEIVARLAGQSDTVSSIGNGTFLWILPQCGAAGAIGAMQRLSRAVELGTHSAPVLSVTVSAGHAQWTPSMEASGLVDAARNALLQPGRMWHDGLAKAA